MRAEKNGNEARRQRSKRLTLTKDRRFAQAGSHDVSDARRSKQQNVRQPDFPDLIYQLVF
jgi:hypothetical protein